MLVTGCVICMCVIEAGVWVSGMSWVGGVCCIIV